MSVSPISVSFTETSPSYGSWMRLDHKAVGASLRTIARLEGEFGLEGETALPRLRGSPRYARCTSELSRHLQVNKNAGGDVFEDAQ